MKHRPPFAAYALLMILAAPVALAASAPRHLEREAIRRGLPLTWAESLRERARAEGDDPLREHRQELLAFVQTSGILPPQADIAQCAERLEEQMWTAKEPPALAEHIRAVPDTLGPTVPSSLRSEPLVSAALQRVWMTAGLRSFDAGLDSVFSKAVPAAGKVAGLQAFSKLLTNQPPGSFDADRYQALLDTTAGMDDARLAAAMHAFAAYASWAHGKVPAESWADAARPATSDRQPEAAKYELALRFASSEKPTAEQRAGILSVALVLDGWACSRWSLDARLMAAEDCPLSDDLVQRYASVLEADPAWFASRGHCIRDFEKRYDRAPIPHPWWQTEPTWYATRRSLERQIDALLDTGSQPDLGKAFLLVQQAKCLPLTEAGQTLPAPVPTGELVKHFRQSVRTFHQHAYLEYYWGENRQVVFTITNRGGAFLEHEPLNVQPLRGVDETQIVEAIRRLIDNQPLADASLCLRLMPVRATPSMGTDAVPLCGITGLRVTIAPDGPLWGLPFEAIPRPGGGTLGAEDAQTRQDPFFSYTPTAAAIQGGKSSLVWLQCWTANYNRALGNANLSLPANQESWVRRSPKNFALALVPGLPFDRFRRLFSARTLSYSQFQANRDGLKLGPKEWGLIFVETDTPRSY